MKNKLKSFEDGYVKMKRDPAQIFEIGKAYKTELETCNYELRILKPSVKNKERFSSWLEFEQDFQ